MLTGYLEKVVRKLSVETPSSQLVDAYLTEIAKAYGVKWALIADLSEQGDDSSDGGLKVGF